MRIIHHPNRILREIGLSGYAPMSLSNSKFLRLIQVWVADTYPGTPAKKIIIEFEDGESLTLPVPSRVATRQIQEKRIKKEVMTQKNVRLHSKTRSKVLAYLSLNPDEWHDRKKLASLADCRYNSCFRATLSQLIKEKLIETRDDEKVKFTKPNTVISSQR